MGLISFNKHEVFCNFQLKDIKRLKLVFLFSIEGTWSLISISFSIKEIHTTPQHSDSHPAPAPLLGDTSDLGESNRESNATYHDGQISEMIKVQSF